MTAFRDAVRPALHGLGDEITLTLTDAGSPNGAGPESATIPFVPAGAAEIERLTPSAIRARFPMPQSVDVETVAAPFIEFSGPDLPWRYAPSTGDDPWLVLVAADPANLVQDAEGVRLKLSEEERVVRPREGAPRGETFDLLDDAALWAHVIHEDDLAARAGTDGRARLIDPRAMPAGASRVACLCVRPAAPSSDHVELRVLDHWPFRTHAEAGDARLLAQQLRILDIGSDPRVATATVTYPAAAGAVALPMSGVLIPASRTADAAVPADVTAELAARKAPPVATDGRPVLGLPDYGYRYASPGTAAPWREQLNDDPRLRAAASLGIEAARRLEDVVMRAARAQLSGLVPAQRLTAAAALGTELRGVWRSRRFALTAKDEHALETRGPFAPHVRTDAGGRSVAVALDETSLGADAATPAASAALRGQGLSPVAAIEALARRAPAELPRTASGTTPALAAVWARTLDVVQSDANSQLPITEEDGTPGTLGSFEDRLHGAGSTGAGLSPYDLLAWVASLREELRATLTMHAAAQALRHHRGDGNLPLWAGLGGDWLDPPLSAEDLDDPTHYAKRILAGSPATDGILLAATAQDSQRAAQGLRQAGDGIAGAGDPQALETEKALDALAGRVKEIGHEPMAGPGLVWAAVMGRSLPLSSLHVIVDPLFSETPRLRLSQPGGEAPAGLLPVSRVPQAVDPEALSSALETAIGDGGGPAAAARFGDALPEGPLRAPLGLDTPGWSYLRDHARDWILPGRNLIPDHSIAVMRTNAAFIDAFMVGFNEGVLSELLWRGIDVDRTSTPCRNFWDLDTENGWVPDIAPIADWGNTPLGHADHRQGFEPGDRQPTDYLTILLKTPLLRRYPALELRLEMPDDAGWTSAFPAIQGAIDADVHFVGFDVSMAEAAGARLVLEQGTADGGYRAVAGPDPWNGPDAPEGRGAAMAVALWRLRIRIVMDLGPHLEAP